MDDCPSLSDVVALCPPSLAPLAPPPPHFQSP